MLPTLRKLLHPHNRAFCTEPHLPALFPFNQDGLQTYPSHSSPARHQEEHYSRLRKKPGLHLYIELSTTSRLITFLQITRPEDLKSLCLTCKQLRDIATPPLYRKVLLFIGGHKDVRVSSLLSQTNPGIEHIRKVYLQLEKTQLPSLDFQVNSDDSSEDEGDAHPVDIVGAARQAQFTVRLLLDFLPHDILESFR